MMIDAKAKKFDKVVVKDVSRFARNTKCKRTKILWCASRFLKQWRSNGRWL